MANRIPEGMANALPNITTEELAASQTAAKAMPSWKEIKSAFGEKAVADKKINLDMATPEGRKNRGKLVDMMLPAWAKEADRGHAFNKSVTREKVMDKYGRVRELFSENVEMAKQSNEMHSVPSWGRRRKRLMTFHPQYGLVKHE